MATIAESPAQALARLMQRPQRHRLLHGYPLAAAMPAATDATPADVALDAGRGLLVGVLPHPYCNPEVTGCGFCTFAHEPFRADAAASVADAVALEIRQRAAADPDRIGRKVSALYFGGGTANLTPAEPFRRLCRQLRRTFDLSGAEVTLEGVPAYFLRGEGVLLDILRDELPGAHFRLSMGVQTFDEARLERMGRTRFGTPDTFRRVVQEAHARGMTASADLLYNLPGQSLAAMKDDVARALEAGYDHLGMYHLVLFRGIGTEWAKDQALLDALPSNEVACGNWIALRERLLARGFKQTTLTNFERTGHFIYEERSFRPHRFDMLGFGPGAISYADNLKLMNPDRADAYAKAVARGGPVRDRAFHYGEWDQRVFHVTRRLAALSIEVDEYAALFGTELEKDFGDELFAATIEPLLDVDDKGFVPTPRGMFYADSLAGVFAMRSLPGRRAKPGHEAPSNMRGHM